MINIDSKNNELKRRGKREREMSREWIVEVEIGTIALKDVKFELIQPIRIDSRPKKIKLRKKQ